MITVGIILFLVAAALCADIVLENSGHTDVVIIGQTLSFDIWGLFALGAAAGVLLVAALQLIAHGLARTGRRRRQLRRLARHTQAGEPQPVSGGSEPASVPAPSPKLPPTSPQALAPRPAPSPPPPPAPPPPQALAPTRPKAGPFDRVVARVADRGRRDDTTRA